MICMLTIGKLVYAGKSKSYAEGAGKHNCCGSWNPWIVRLFW